jgi:hypothetical protein
LVPPCRINRAGAVSISKAMFGRVLRKHTPVAGAAHYSFIYI